MAIRHKFPSRQADQFALRFPEGMRKQIKAAADANGRSMNSEIIARIHESLSGNTEDRLVRAVSQLEALILIASPSGETIRLVQDEAMEPVSVTGKSPVGAGSHLSIIDTEDRSGEAA